MTFTSPSTRLVIGNFLRFEFDFHKGKKSFCQTIYIFCLFLFTPVPPAMYLIIYDGVGVAGPQCGGPMGMQRT